jgi:hypothetical protein
MQPHQPRDLSGPVRGTETWWRGLPKSDAAGEEERMEGSSHGKGEFPRQPGSPIRKDLVERVRREIAAGTYDTPEKWDAALDCLLDRMNED